MKEKTKGLNIAILVICTLAFMFLSTFMTRLTGGMATYQGIVTEIQVIITTIIVLTNKKTGFWVAIILTAINIFGATMGVLTGNKMAIVGVLTSAVSASILTIIYFFLKKVEQQHQELLNQYEQMIDSNRLMQEKDAALKILAYQDELTGMYNFSYFCEKMTECINQNTAFTVVYMDLDNFKGVNDSFGPEVGDTVLKACAERLSGYCGNRYICARTSGDDFAILISGNTTEADILNMTEQIRKMFAEPVSVPGTAISITASYGIVSYPHDGKVTETLLENAIMSVYNAKANGKDRPCFFSQA